MATAGDPYLTDLSAICRACLAEPINTEMYSFTLEDVRIKFAICTSVTVSAAEDLPYQICAQCWERCTGWHEYRDMCQENNKRLKEGTVFLKQDAVYSIAEQEEEEEVQEQPEEPAEDGPMEDDSPMMEEVILEEIVLEEENELEEQVVDTVSRRAEGKSLDCPICITHSFTDQKLYEEHVRSHYNGVTEKACLVCRKSFVSLYSVIKHTFLHGDQSICCPVCPRIFKGNCQLRSHMNKYHKHLMDESEIEIEEKPEPKPITPPMPPMIVPIIEDILNCPMCGIVFNEEIAYIKHIKGHYLGKSPVCLICSKSFKALASVYSHMNEHTLRCVPCNLCPKTFKGSASLKMHMDIIHSQGPKRTASDHGKAMGADAKQDVRIHVQVEQDGAVSMDWIEEEKAENTDDLLKCPICQVEFTEEKKYEQHVKDHYKEETETKCMVCEKEYRTMNSVIVHTHDHSSRNIPCNFCGKSFKGNYQLNKHIYKYHKMDLGISVAPSRAVTGRGDEVEDEDAEEDDEEEEAAEGLQEDPSEDILKCPICSIVFEQEKHYQRHIKEHYDDATDIRCMVCLRPFKSMFNVIRHTHEHSKRCLRCNFCEKIFRGTYQLNCHMAKYHSADYKALKAERTKKEETTNDEEEVAEPARHPDDILECPICATEFQTEKLYTSHVKEHFAGVSQSKCPLCDLNFSSIGNLITHVHDHSRRHIPCEFCTKVFKGREQQRGHLKKFHKMEHEDGEAKSMFLCEFCPAILKTQRRLSAHKSTQHRQGMEYTVKKEQPESDTVEILECPICHEELDSEKIFDKHIRNHYLDQKDFSCLLCDKVYQSLHCVVMHAHDHGERTVTCKYCDRQFKGTMRMKSHINKYHITEKAVERKGKRPEMFPCPECGKTYLQRSRLKAHMKAHSQEKPFSCQYCPSSFKTQRNLRMHVVQHTSEKNLQCPQCELKFYHEKHLKDHIRRHNRTQSFACELCPKMFSYRSGLNEHMNSHTRERLYTCDVCAKVFERVSVLNRHKTIHAEGHGGGGEGGGRAKGGRKRADGINLTAEDKEEDILIEWEEVEGEMDGEEGSERVEVVVYQ